MKEAVTKSIAKTAFERTKKTFVRKSSVLAIFFLISFACLLLALLTPYTLILTVPFVFFPAVFAFMGINTVFDTDIQKDGIGFFFLFKSYFTRHFNGAFKLFISLLKGLLVGVIASFIACLIGSIIVETTNPELAAKLFEIAQIADVEQYEEAMLALFEEDAMIELAQIVALIGFGCGYLTFIHQAMFHGIKLYFNLLSVTPILARDLNTIHVATYQKIKWPLKKDYFKATWFISLLLALGFGLGVTISILFTTLTIDQVIIVGLFASLVFVTVFIPYYFDVTLTIFKKYHPNYLNTFIELSMQSLNELKKTQVISEEKEKEILDFLNKNKVEESDSEDKPEDDKE